MDEIFGGGNRVKYKYPKNTQRCDANSILNVLSTAFAKQQKYYSTKKNLNEIVRFSRMFKNS